MASGAGTNQLRKVILLLVSRRWSQVQQEHSLCVESHKNKTSVPSYHYYRADVKTVTQTKGAGRLLGTFCIYIRDVESKLTGSKKWSEMWWLICRYRIMPSWQKKNDEGWTGISVIVSVLEASGRVCTGTDAEATRCHRASKRSRVCAGGIPPGASVRDHGTRRRLPRSRCENRVPRGAAALRAASYASPSAFGCRTTRAPPPSPAAACPPARWSPAQTVWDTWESASRELPSRWLRWMSSSSSSSPELLSCLYC